MLKDENSSARICKTPQLRLIRLVEKPNNL